MGLFLHNRIILSEILKKFNVYESFSVKTPIDLNLYLSKNHGEHASQLEYSHIIGNLFIYFFDRYN